MKILIIGGGWYGCHLASELRGRHEVRLVERKAKLFGGASGANPARLHLGFHYPRSRVTRALCQQHFSEFMEIYGRFTSWVPVNLYAVAARDSLVDWGTYRQVMKGEVECFEIMAAEAGLQNVEGVMQVPERHIVLRRVREHFEAQLADIVDFNHGPVAPKGFSPDWTIDCTFSAADNEGIDRYEPCVTAIMKGPTHRAVTVMDGQFPSLYPWDESQGLSSLTSARFTPLAKCSTYAEAEGVIARTLPLDLRAIAQLMIDQMSHFWPEFRELYTLAECRCAIRAQPASASDARTCEVVLAGENRLRVRAGKIDAVIHACQLVREFLI